MIKVVYGKNVYYLNILENEVYNFKMEKLGKKDYAELNFPKQEFINFLHQIHKKKTKIVTHTEESFTQIIVENLKKDEIALTPPMTKGFLKGFNYSIIKVNDIYATLDLLDKIKLKFGLSYIMCTYPLGELKLDPKKKKSVLKFISLPYGSHDKQNFETIPLLLPIVLSQ